MPLLCALKPRHGHPMVRSTALGAPLKDAHSGAVDIGFRRQSAVQVGYVYNGNISVRKHHFCLGVSWERDKAPGGLVLVPTADIPPPVLFSLLIVLCSVGFVSCVRLPSLLFFSSGISPNPHLSSPAQPALASTLHILAWWPFHLLDAEPSPLLSWLSVA